MGQRRQAREYALQVLFQLDVAGDGVDEVLQQFSSSRDQPEQLRAFAESLVRGVRDRLAEIDRRIVDAADNWRIERMAVVDRNVLRMAVHELTGAEGTPAAVVIDESIEIARRFGSEGSAAFVNGILDTIRTRVERERADSASP